MENCTVEGNNTSQLNQTSTSTWVTGVVAFLSSLNIFLSITASLGNALILVALRKESSIHPPTKLLFRCLAVTDLCVGLISQPLFAIFLIHVVLTATGMNSNALYYFGIINNTSSFILCVVSVLLSTAISVDRLLALLLGLRYRHVATLRRARAVVICFSLIGVSCGSISVRNKSIAISAFIALVTLSLVTSIASYFKIYLTLRQQQAQVQLNRQSNGGGFPLNRARYKKTVSSVLWLQLALLVCYIPFIVVVMLKTYYQMSANRLFIASCFTASATYLNSSLNPILYYWTIRSVRQATKDTIKQLNCCESA